MKQIPVLIAGGGPVGLALACELGWRGIDYMLVERNPGINQHPRANVVASRTMEHFRRWGIAERVARAGLPLDYPVEVVFATRVCRDEIFRFSFPSYAECMQPTQALRASLPDLDFSPYFKTSVGQHHLEPVLMEFAASHRGADLRFGWRLGGFTQDSEGVIATVVDTASGNSQQVRAAYLAACDGGHSEVRAALGVGMNGQGVLGRFLGIFLRAPAFATRHKLGPATLYWTLNGDAPGVFIAVDGRDQFTFQRSLRPDERSEEIDPRATVDAAFGAPLDCEIISVQPWNAHALVADRYSSGRVFLVGDAAHLFVPTGGFGMNTGIGDAVDLGWKLAAMLDGWGGRGLLDSHDTERRPVGVRNTSEAADNYLKMLPVFARSAETELPGKKGEDARVAIAASMAAVRKHFAATGIHLGARYEDSPICVPDSSPAPPDNPERYVPTSRPGSRAPHVALVDGTSTLDLFGRGFVMLGFEAGDTGALERAAHAAGVPLEVVQIRDEQAARIYERHWVLVRPDGHVAWRGNVLPAEPGWLIDRVRGALLTSQREAETSHETA